MYQKTSSGYRTLETRRNGAEACPDETPSTDGATALQIRPDWRTNPTMRVRRPSRTQETSALHRGRALMHMRATLATSQSQWLRDVDEWIKDLDMRSDGRENRRKVARVLGFNADWSTLTTNTLTWSTISERTGMSRATVARHLLALHEAGWVGRVAAGRSAAAKRAAGWTGDEAFLNDAPVYALTTPATAVDINETPPTLRGSKEFPARARETEPPTGAASRPSPPEAASGLRRTVPADRSLPAWPGHVTPRSKDERGLAGREWARRVPALRQLSDEHLRFLAKDFFTAGWTIRDLVTALDELPDGRAHGQFTAGQWIPYSGADGIPSARLGHWVSWRLNAWRDPEGRVVESPTQLRTRRAASARREQEARRVAEARRRQEHRQTRSTPEYQAAKAACLEQFFSRSRFRETRLP